jgi:tRNA threonylcarbamoyladenosine biosynthesis protein TsaB
MITLALDASTYRGTVAVLDDDRVVVHGAAAMRGKDAELLMPAVHEVLTEAGCGTAGIGRVVCGSGPGSFTSLRIAASIAKGIAVGRGVPLFAVSSLALIVAGNVLDGPRGARKFLAVLDALRGESYTAQFTHEAGGVRQVSEMRIVPTEDVVSLAEALGARAVGPDQRDPWLPHARGMALLGALLDANGPIDVATWEPLYGRVAEAQAKWEAVHGRALPR